MVKWCLLSAAIAACLSVPNKPAPDGRLQDGPIAHDTVTNDTPPPIVAFGDPAVESDGPDPHPCGLPEASSFVVTNPATIESIYVYYAGAYSSDDATRMEAGIYDNVGMAAHQLKVDGYLDNQGVKFAAHQWLRVPVPMTSLNPGVYWIAAMCPVGYGSNFSVPFAWTGPNQGDGACDPTGSAALCTSHGNSDETTLDPTFNETAHYYPSQNSFYASKQ